MKRFIGFIKKEFLHIFRDRRALFILFGMPVAQIMLFGFAITNEINNVEIAVLDHSKDEVTQEIIQRIAASKYFSIREYLGRENEIESAFKKGTIKKVVDPASKKIVSPSSTKEAANSAIFSLLRMFLTDFSVRDCSCSIM